MIIYLGNLAATKTTPTKASLENTNSCFFKKAVDIKESNEDWRVQSEGVHSNSACTAARISCILAHIDEHTVFLDCFFIGSNSIQRIRKTFCYCPDNVLVDNYKSTRKFSDQAQDSSFFGKSHNLWWIFTYSYQYFVADVSLNWCCIFKLAAWLR